MIINPTPVSKMKLKGPLSFILSCIITRLRINLKGILTDFLPLFRSKYCAFTGTKQKHSKQINPMAGRNLI